MNLALAPTNEPQPSRLPMRQNSCVDLARQLPDWVVQVLRKTARVAEQVRVSVFGVGGFVRDLLLDRPNVDIDLVVEGDGVAFARVLAKELNATIQVHSRFRTATVTLPNGFKFDVATTRTEVYRHAAALPMVRPCSLREDLHRRDFTVNAIAIRLDERSFGAVVDFYGGLHDLDRKVIRVLHNHSFVDDPTRVFRAVRFEQRLGFRLSKDTESLVRGVVTQNLVRRLSAARVLREIMLLLSEIHPHKPLARLAALGVLKLVHPALGWSSRQEALCKAVGPILTRYEAGLSSGAVERWVIYLMALLAPLSPKAREAVLQRLRVPTRQADKVRVGATLRARDLDRLARQRLRPSEVYRLLKGQPDEAIICLLARTRSARAKRQVSAYLRLYQHVKPALGGAELRAMGITPGPIYKKILDRLLDARLNGETNTEADERQLVRRLANV